MDHNTRTPNAKTEQNETQNNTTATHMLFLLSQKATNPTGAPAPGNRTDVIATQMPLHIDFSDSVTAFLVYSCNSLHCLQALPLEI